MKQTRMLDASDEVRSLLGRTLTALIAEERHARGLTSPETILAEADDMLFIATGRLLDHALVMYEIAKGRED